MQLALTRSRLPSGKSWDVFANLGMQNQDLLGTVLLAGMPEFATETEAAEKEADPREIAGEAAARAAAGGAAARAAVEAAGVLLRDGP